MQERLNILEFAFRIFKENEAELNGNNENLSIYEFSDIIADFCDGRSFKNILEGKNIGSKSKKSTNNE